MLCKLCGCEKSSRRAMNMHLLRQHPDDYKRADFILERLVTDPVPKIKEPSYKVKEAKKKYPRPAGFRLLNEADHEEAAAIKAGFSFIDDEENIYTEEEARVEEWV